MVGGSSEAFLRASYVLSCLGSTIVHVGPVGSGQVVKAVNQIMVAGILATLSGGMALLEATEANIVPALDALSRGHAGSALLEAKARQMLSKNYDPGFKVGLHLKDLAIVIEFARSIGIALPVTGLVNQLLVRVEASGGGGFDHCAIIESIRALSADRRDLKQHPDKS